MTAKNPLARDRKVRPDLKLAYICAFETDAFAKRVFRDYGAVFVVSPVVSVPDRCIFADDEDVQAFQSRLKFKTAILDGVIIELQSAAMDALLEAVSEAAAKRLRITPLDGSIAARRSYADTVRIWNSRFLPALSHWMRKGKISRRDADTGRNADIYEQVKKVMGWESRGLYFSTNFTRSIFSSTAPPGTSQHLSMLAFDVVQYGNREVRRILNKHGWFQTVVNDEPHFTYLGFSAKELPSRGLRNTVKGNYKFWVPDFE